MKKILLSLSLATALAVPQQAFALGSGAMANVTATSAKAAGHGFAFAGVADDPSAIWFNPAGISQLKGWQMTLGSEVLHLHTSHESPAGTVDTMASKYTAIPFFYLTGNPNDSKWTLGLGVNAPYGLASEWRENSFSKFYATRSDLFLYAINPTVAYEVTEKVSVALGADYFNAFDVQLNSLVPPVPGLGGTNVGRFKLKGNGDGWGYNAGVLWKPVDRHSFGVSYRSQVNVPIAGDATGSGLDATWIAAGVPSNFSSNITSEFKFPQTVTLGYGFKPSDRTTFYADYEWANWKVVDATNIDFASPNTLTSAVSHIPRHWKNSNNVGTGVQVKANERWDLRAGALVYERVIPNSTLESSLPESSRWMISLGTGYHIGSTTIDAALGDIFYNTRNVTNSLQSGTLNGKYKTQAPFASLSVSQKFGGK